MSLIRNLTLAAALAVTSAASAQPAAKPTDPQIAHIAYTADNIDIKAGELALKKSKNKDVIAFANDMIRDHNAVNEKALALLKKLKVEPQDNDTSRALTKQAEAEMQKLNSLEGAAFDKEYANHEVAYHRAVNDTLRTTLIPAANNAELKDLLTTGLKLFEGHQQHAEQVAKELK
jgi:putative membrane protein